MLEHYLKTLKLPTFLKCYSQVADQCKEKGADYSEFLLQLSEKEVSGRHSRMVQQKIKNARFPALKTLDSFDFKALQNLEQRQVRDLATCDYIERHESVIALGVPAILVQRRTLRSYI